MNKEVLRYIFWEWIEPIGSALCIALLVMKFIMAIYVIPTGSMQPTLRGQGNYGSGDKVLVNKFIYRFDEPKRWDVIVFEYPFHIMHCKRCKADIDREKVPKHDENGKATPAIIEDNDFCPGCGKDDKLTFIEKDYIKRCVAVPGDELMIKHGNILLKQESGKWGYSVKTKEAQDALWVKEFFMQEDFDAFESAWVRNSAVDANGSTLHLKDGAKMNYANEIRGYGDQGYFPSRDQIRSFGDGPYPIGAGMMGDIRLDLSLNAIPSSGTLELNIKRNGVSHIALVDFASKKIRFVLSVTINGQETRSEIGTKVVNAFGDKITWARVDGQLKFRSGENEEIIQLEEANVSDQTLAITPIIKMSGGELNLKNLKLSRDIYYSSNSTFLNQNGNLGSYKVKNNEYFSMGDNSYYSSDSRYWGPVRHKYLIGKALGAFWMGGITTGNFSVRTKLIH